MTYGASRSKNRRIRAIAHTPARASRAVRQPAAGARRAAAGAGHGARPQVALPGRRNQAVQVSPVQRAPRGDRAWFGRYGRADDDGMSAALNQASAGCSNGSARCRRGRWPTTRCVAGDVNNRPSDGTAVLTERAGRCRRARPGRGIRRSRVTRLRCTTADRPWRRQRAPSYKFEATLPDPAMVHDADRVRPVARRVA
jgi:hypothetical protein